MKLSEDCWRSYLWAFCIARGVESDDEDVETNDLLAMALAANGTAGPADVSLLLTRDEFYRRMEQFGAEEERLEGEESSPC